MVSKFIKCIPLFVVFLIANFIFINNVSANQVTCTYKGDVFSIGEYSITAGLDDLGNLIFEEPTYKKNNCRPNDTYCEEKSQGVDINTTNKISVQHKVKAEHFSQDNELITKCPSLYVTIVTEAVYHKASNQLVSSSTSMYIGTSKEDVDVDATEKEETFSTDVGKRKRVVKVSKQNEIPLASQSFNRGDKFYLNGVAVNDLKPMVCKYKSEDEKTFNLQTVNDKSWINSPGFGANISIADLENQGNIPYDSCVKDLYAQCNENENRCVVGKGASGTKFTYQGDLELIGESTLEGSFLGKIDGCEMLGSLGVLASELFKILQVIAICLLIVMGMKDFAAALPSGDNNAISKAFKSFVKRIAVIIILFLLPVLINWLLEQISLANNCIIEIAK